jgi:hypothetical protein
MDMRHSRKGPLADVQFIHIFSADATPTAVRLRTSETARLLEAQPVAQADLAMLAAARSNTIMATLTKPGAVLAFPRHRRTRGWV